MVAFYNAPDSADDLVAAFHTLAEAQAYADTYGGEVVASGVVFTVGRGADHARAKDDAAALAREEARKAIANGAGIETPSSAPTQSQADFDAAVNAAVERAMLARAGTTTPTNGEPTPTALDSTATTENDQAGDGR